MANYPVSLDNFTNPNSSNTLDNPSHSLQHADANDAIEALQAKLGIGVSTAASATSGQVLTAQGGGTAIWDNLPADTSGLIYIETQNPSGVSSVSFSNNVFSSTYDNYFLIGYITSTAASYVQFRIRGAGSDVTTTTYTQQKLDVNSTTVSGTRSTGEAKFQLGFADTGNTEFTTFIQKPFLAVPTTIKSDNVRKSATPAVQITWGYNTNSTSYDSLTVFMDSGNMTGSLSLFGVKK